MLNSLFNVNFCPDDAPSEPELDLAEQLCAHFLTFGRSKCVGVLNRCSVILFNFVIAFSFEQVYHVLLLRLKSLLKASHRLERVVDIVKFVADLSDAQIHLLLEELRVDLCHVVEVLQAHL